MIGVDEATRRIRAAVRPLPDETVSLSEAGGRVLRGAVRADREVPPFDRVTMDGIAFAHAAWAAGRTGFAVRGAVAAGQAPVRLPDPSADCLEVMTGAVLPPGCDCVVPAEQVSRTGEKAVLLPGVRVDPGQFVHKTGSDRREGDILLRPGCRLDPARIGIAASAGCADLTVARRPVIGLVSTGDELVDVGRPLQPFQIRPSNRYAIRAALRQRGFTDLRLLHLPDDPPAMARDLPALLADCDLAILSGGVSAGARDHVPGVLERIGVRRVFHQVRQRPGKPLWFGLAPGGEPVFALPGNPVSAFMCLHRYVLAHLDHMMGVEPPVQTAVLTAPMVFAPPLTGLLPVRETETGDGRCAVAPIPYHGSGDLTALDRGTGFVELDAQETEFPAGTVVPYYPW